MKAQTNFFDFIGEEADDLDRDDIRRLQDMGVEPIDPDEAWTEMTDEWYSDPKVEAALQTLRDRFEEIWTTHYRDEYEEDWGQKEEWFWSDADKEDIGTFGYFLINR